MSVHLSNSELKKLRSIYPIEESQLKGVLTVVILKEMGKKTKEIARVLNLKLDYVRKVIRSYRDNGLDITVAMFSKSPLAKDYFKIYGLLFIQNKPIWLRQANNILKSNGYSISNPQLSRFLVRAGMPLNINRGVKSSEWINYESLKRIVLFCRLIEIEKLNSICLDIFKLKANQELKANTLTNINNEYSASLAEKLQGDFILVKSNKNRTLGNNDHYNDFSYYFVCNTWLNSSFISDFIRSLVDYLYDPKYSSIVNQKLREYSKTKDGENLSEIFEKRDLQPFFQKWVNKEISQSSYSRLSRRDFSDRDLSKLMLKRFIIKVKVR